MKKVVVVVSQNPTVCQTKDMKVTEFRQEEFEGKCLIVINKLPDLSYSGSYYGSELLIVKDGKEELAVFKDWLYWKKVE